MERSDSELVRDSRHGDKEAFRELVEKYQRKIMSLGLGMLKNQDDAMELTQETFVKAYENLPRFKGESSFYTWLYRIAVNLAIDTRRRQKKKRHMSLSEPIGEDGAEFGSMVEDERSPDPFQESRSKQIGERVREAIHELTPDHKAVILLREVEGLSYDDISRVMQCSKGTVMSRLFYARKKLQSGLKDLL